MLFLGVCFSLFYLFVWQWVFLTMLCNWFWSKLDFISLLVIAVRPSRGCFDAIFSGAYALSLAFSPPSNLRIRLHSLSNFLYEYARVQCAVTINSWVTKFPALPSFVIQTLFFFAAMRFRVILMTIWYILFRLQSFNSIFDRICTWWANALICSIREHEKCFASLLGE